MPMTVKAPRPASIDLEERVEEFERSFASGNADIADFLPPIDHPNYRALLGELIRVEIELLWDRKSPRLVETYLARFPLLQSDADLLGAIAFEEYRQRIQAGERVTPDEYRKHFGLDMARWPGLEFGDRADLRTSALDWEEMRSALATPERTASFSGTTPEVKTALPEPGDLVLRRFRIVERLGKGAFGSVFLAERLDLFNRPVALKFLPGPSAEAAMLAEMIHENIVPIESVDRYGSMLVICMPYRGPTTLQHVVDGLPRSNIAALSTGKLFLSTLQERSGTRSRVTQSDEPDSGGSGVRPGPEKSGMHLEVRPLSQLEKLAGMTHIEASLRIILGVVNGLAHAHDHNIFHRDLKPANILLADDGTPMILDFNLATQVRKDRPLDCIKMGGTFPYMAPEQIKAGRDKRECRDARSDLYSLGVVMFELLSGQAPFPKGKRLSDDYLDQLLRDRRDLRPDLSRLNPAVPAGVVDIIRKLLAFDPKERYQTARDLKDDLERELSNRQLKYARESSPRARLAKFRRRYPALTTALAALIFLILPATAVTGVKYRSYQRLKERQTAEALVKFDDSLRTCYEVQTLTHSRNHDARLFDRGVGKAEELVRGYGIDAADAWDASPDITRLDVSRRQQLFDNLGNAFFVISEATAQQARDSGDSELTGCAERWKKLADDCFGKAGRSPELGKNLRPSPSDFAKLDETELLDLANGLMNDGRYRQATFALRELTDRNPKHFMAWFNLAHSLDNLGAFADSVHAWRTCTALEPDFAVCHYNLGMTWLSANQPGLAERSFGQALRCDEQLVNALAYRAVCRSRQENLDGAEADLTEALSREPDKTSYRLLRAQVRQKLGKMREAAEDEAAGLGREPDDEFGYAMRGYYRMFPTSADLVTRPEKVVADLKSALADFDHAIAINSRNQATLRNKAVALEQLNRIDDAVAVYGSVLKYYPDLLSARATRGVLLARLGRVREAVAEAKLCESAVPTPFMEYQLGSLYAAASAHDTRYKADANRLLASSLRHGLERPELFRTDADLAPLRADERFQRLVGLAEVMVTTRSQLARP